VVIYQGEREVGRVVLDDRQRVTALALLPPAAGHEVPILAVASGDEGPPTLRLYQAARGDLFRELAGHTDPIRSLAFSSDGRFLVSAGEDQTICVWSLTNLDKILKRHGQLTGLVVTEDHRQLVIARVHAGSSANGLLKEKGVIEGFVEDSKLVRITSVR